MARKTVPPTSQRHIGQVEDALDDVRDGLVRIGAVADLLALAGSDDPLDTETLEGAAGTIHREVEDLRRLVGDAIEDLKTIKSQRPASAVPLEVLDGGAA